MPTSKNGREQSLKGKLLNSLVRLRHGVASQQGKVHPFDSNGLNIHDADET